MIWQHQPIRRTLILITVFTCTIVLVLACGAIAAFELLSFRESMRHEAIVLADILGENSQAALAFADDQAAESTLGGLRAHPSVVAARVFDASGEPFASYLKPEVALELPARPEADGYRFADSHLTVFRPITLEGRSIGAIALVVDLKGLYDRIRLFAAISALVLGGSLVVAFAMSAQLQRPISEPILALARIATVVAERKDYTVRAPAGGTNEVGALTDAFNHMLTEIDQQNRLLKQQAAELLRSNAELEQFTYVSSHDLKEPLRMVALHMDMLEHHAGAGLDQESQQYVRNAIAGANRLKQLIEDILSYARLDRPDAELAPVALDEVARDAIANNSAEIEHVGATVAVEPLPDVLGERSQLVQLLQNLIGNAIKFRGEAPPRVDIAARRDGDAWVVSVRDHGIGVDPMYREKIFDMFQRLHARDAYPGTGIGLAICRKIVERHGGRIWVESPASGPGSLFLFTLKPVSVPA